MYKLEKKGQEKNNEHMANPAPPMPPLYFN